MYKVFFKDSLFLLTDDQNLLKEGTCKFIHTDFNATKNIILQLLHLPDKFTAVVYNEDLEELTSIFKSCFIYTKAAGGAVIQDNRVLVIKRLGMYDLPKGHLESCETIEQCAIREVKEECGLEDVEITGPLAHTLHIYHRNDSWFLKKTYWYKMSCPPAPCITPQTEEGIEAVFWQPLTEIPLLFEHTYPSLREVFEKISQQPQPAK